MTVDENSFRFPAKNLEHNFTKFNSSFLKASTVLFDLIYSSIPSLRCQNQVQHQDVMKMVSFFN
jgi:hypothetical protein